MKAKTTLLITAIIIMAILAASGTSWAGVSEVKTQHTIYVRLIVPGNLSMDLEEDMVRQNLLKPEAEAFAELKDEGMYVDKVTRGDLSLWLFTKTE